MSAELVERLRGHAEIMARDKGKFVRFIDAADCIDAADLIEAQAAEIERLRKVLADIAEYGDDPEHPAVLNIADKARDALESKP